MSGLWRRMLGRDAPAGFHGELDGDERVLGDAVSTEGAVLATSHGLWLPFDGAHRLLGWHLISRANWSPDVLTLVEADEIGTAGSAVLLADRAPAPYRLLEARSVPRVILQRVTGSIKSSQHRELPGGGAWFVQRTVRGVDGVVLQVRPDPGADVDAIRPIAVRVADGLDTARKKLDD
ncbi:MAG: hypothetical protein ACRDRL_09680 [Sciscionella sp.]